MSSRQKQGGPVQLASRRRAGLTLGAVKVAAARLDSELTLLLPGGGVVRLGGPLWYRAGKGSIRTARHGPDGPGFSHER